MKIFQTLIFMLALIAGPGLAAAKVDVFALANAAYDSGQLEKAAALYKDAGRKGLQPAIAWFNYGNCQARLGKRGEAAAAWRKALEWAPRFKRARMNLAILSEEDGQIGVAASEYRRLWELDPKDATVAIRLGELQLSQNDPVGGVEWFGKALVADSVSSGAYEGMVRAHLLAHDTIESQLLLLRWSEMVPDTSARSWFVKSALWEQAHGWEQARATCEAGLAYAPENIEGWLRLARLHQLAGSDATAVAVLKTATTKNPRQGRLWKALGQSALRAGDASNSFTGLSEAAGLGERGVAELARILSSWHEARGEKELANRAKELWKSAKK